MPGPYHTPGVYIEEIPSGSRPIQGVSTSIAAFLGVTEKCPVDESGATLLGRPFLVTSWDQYTEYFGGYPEGAMLPVAVRGFFENGGGICYVESLMTAGAPAARGNGAPARPTLQLPSRAAGGAPALELESKVSEPVTVIVSDASEPGEDLFKVVVRSAGGQEETYDNVTFNRGREVRNVVQALQRSKLVAVREIENPAPLAERRPAASTYTLPAPLAAPAQAPAKSITELAQGNLDDRVGLDGLEAITEITMVCMPDIMEMQRTGKISMEDAIGLQSALIAHCEKMGDRMAILDAPYGMKVQQVKEWRTAKANYSSKFAALYYPWIVIQNPRGRGQIAAPPSGFMAGIYARVDSERGVHKAPANEVVRLATDLELQVTDREQALLNPVGVNCIRAFPGRGIRVWGARTLDDPAGEWRYINVRRLFNYIEESIFEGTQWVVFEPNDMDLWERVKRTVSAFLTGLWRDGMLFGATPEEAFYVRCDAALNPPSSRDRGELHVEVGIAPVKPAEFVVFRFKQLPGGGEISE
ncbi:MAG TPA: phage tail sheath subtilisin-like domain-containing protein [Roseiflexaceae bacterium]|nr:phage tail sheath subtilisin-like domain-containing protein [Roseiflexaceae bacterium]